MPRRKKPRAFPILFFAAVLYIFAQYVAQIADSTGANHSLSPEDLAMEQRIREIIGKIDSPDSPFQLPINAVAASLLSTYSLSENDVASLLSRYSEEKRRSGYSFLDRKKNPFIASAMGIDRRHHFLNSYLVGYEPLSVSEVWMPLDIIAMRMKYQFDSDQFPGYSELWLSSYQAFQNGRGDCEDHALALADWLIEMGEDARVATGFYKKEGHAWVVVLRESGTFILEATDKRRRQLWSAYPLAKLATDYEAHNMFNRDTYWMNREPAKRGSYTGSQWTEVGRVTR